MHFMKFILWQYQAIYTSILISIFQPIFSFIQGLRLKLIHTLVMNTRSNATIIFNRLVYFAISVGIREKVNELTE